MIRQVEAMYAYNRGIKSPLPEVDSDGSRGSSRRSSELGWDCPGAGAGLASSGNSVQSGTEIFPDPVEGSPDRDGESKSDGLVGIRSLFDGQNIQQSARTTNATKATTLTIAYNASLDSEPSACV